MDLHLKGKSVVITGGGTGIGKEAAKEFAREGARVSICGRRLNRLEEVKAELKAEGLDLDVYQLDVCDTGAMKKMADEIAAKNGGIDVWFNNAGVAINKPVMEFTKEDYDYVMKINLESVYEGCRIAGRHMIDQGRGGVILNTSSFVTKIPHSEGTLYAASKAGVNSLTRTFAANFAPYGIRVVGIIPGMIITEISTESVKKNEALYVQNVPMHRLGKPEDLAKPIAFAASDACSYITGVEIEVSGGKYAVQNSEYPWKVKEGQA